MKLVLHIEINETDLPESIDLKTATKDQKKVALTESFHSMYVESSLDWVNYYKIIDEKFVIEEFHVFGGWTAIEGSGEFGNILVTYDSYEEAEQSLKEMLENFIYQGLEGYSYPSENFRVRALSCNTKLRDGLKLPKLEEVLI